jgi:hypothetical protein
MLSPLKLAAFNALTPLGHFAPPPSVVIHLATLARPIQPLSAKDQLSLSTFFSIFDFHRHFFQHTVAAHFIFRE